MVHRDPQSGQFVSDHGNSNSMAFRDLEHLHIRNTYEVSAAELPAAFPVEESDIVTTEFSDILDRDERADLIGLRINSLQASVPGTTSAEAALDVAFELTLGAGDELSLLGDRSIRTSSGSSGVVQVESWDSDSPDVLYHAAWVAEGGFADSTNGLGGGPDAPVITDDVNYVRELGTCPELDDRDEVTQSFYLEDNGSADISDSLVRLDVSFTMVFAIRERE